MRGTLALIGAAAMLVAGALPGRGSDAEIMGEFRRDSYEYGEPARDFYRASISLSFDETSRFGAAYLQDATGDMRRYTWFLAIASRDRRTWLMMGNYYAHFGTGLIVGRKRPFSPDPFSAQALSSTGRSFSPCKNGDQRYSFHGLSMGTTLSWPKLSISFMQFYSIRYRYAHADANAAGYSGSSIATLCGSTVKKYPYVTPIVVLDGGAMAEVTAGRWGILQGYGIRTEIREPGGGRMGWDMDPEGWPSGNCRSYGAWGLFLSLRGGPITLHAEAGFMCRQMSGDPGVSRTVRGRALQGGCTFRHGVLSFFMKGRETDTGFYAPYALNDSFPLRRWETGLSAWPFSFLYIGVAHGAEKRLLPAPGEDRLRITSRQRAWIKLFFPGRNRAVFSGRRLERRGEEGSTSYQGKAALHSNGPGPFTFGISSLGQKSGSGPIAWSCTAMAGWRWRKILRVSLYYTCAAAHAGSPLYVNNSALFRSPASGSFADRPVHCIGGGISSAIGGAMAGIQYGHQFHDSKRGSWRFEAFCRFRL